MSDSETPNANADAWAHDDLYDAGDAGCGEVLLDLKLHFRKLAPGARVLIVARDPGAPLEMPAWCRLTGHTLLATAHPRYLVRKRIDP